MCTIGAVVQGNVRSGRRVAEEEQEDLKWKSLKKCVLFHLFAVVTHSLFASLYFSLPHLFLSLLPRCLTTVPPSFTRVTTLNK